VNVLPERQAQDMLNEPQTVNHIIGDGNCFERLVWKFAVLKVNIPQSEKRLLHS
jgi:hypothetical protein